MELLGFVQLLGDFTPEKVIWTVATIESCDLSCIKRVSVRDPGAMFLSQLRMLSQRQAPLAG